LPFLIAFLVWRGLLGNLENFYRRSYQKISSGQAAFKGTVTNPALGPDDFFGWFFCLRSIVVERADRSQLRVHMPRGSIVPRPGEQLAVFESGKSFGVQRYIGILYAPHVAIIHGVR